MLGLLRLGAVAGQEPGVFIAAAQQKNEKKCRALLAHKDAPRAESGVYRPQ